MPTVHPQVQKARDLVPLIAAASDENDEIRELTKPVVKALIDGGFFTMLKTKSVGGMELKPSIFAQVTEAIASADGSTGWVVCQSNGCSTTSAYLDPNMAQEIFGRPDGIVAWGPPGSPYEATPVEGGYRITGKWRFMSGSQNATWLGAHLRVAGTKETKTFLYPKSSATFHDIWHTLGLRGTASNEYSVDNLFIPHERAIYRDDPRDRRSDSPLYRFTSNQLYSIGFGGVALGIARGTMDAFLALPREKTRRGAGKPMVENNVVQSHVAQSEARWRSARYFLHAAADEALETIEEQRRDGSWISAPACASPPPGPFSRHGRSSTRCFTTAARWRCSRKIRSNAVCATSTRSRNRARGGYCTTRRSVRSCLACRRRIFSSGGQARPVVSADIPEDRTDILCARSARQRRSPLTLGNPVEISDNGSNRQEDRHAGHRRSGPSLRSKSSRPAVGQSLARTVLGHRRGNGRRHEQCRRRRRDHGVVVQRL